MQHVPCRWRRRRRPWRLPWARCWRCSGLRVKLRACLTNGGRLLEITVLLSMNPRHAPLVWRWARAYRKSQTNIGVEYYRIPIELRALLDDCQYWLAHDTYPSDEIAARFHHKLMS